MQKKRLLYKNKRVFDLMEHESTNKSVDRIITENLVSIYFYRTFSFYWQIEHVKLMKFTQIRTLHHLDLFICLGCSETLRFLAYLFQAIQILIAYHISC